MLSGLVAQASTSDGDELAIVVSAAAALIALGALVHSVVTSRSERRDRQAGLALLREQIEDERRRHDELRLDERRADLVARQGQISGSDPDDGHEIFLVNAGRSAARKIAVRVVGEDGEALTREFNVPDLAPDADATLDVPIPATVGRGQQPISLQARWTDGAGDHDEQLIELRPLR